MGVVGKHGGAEAEHEADEDGPRHVQPGLQLVREAAVDEGEGGAVGEARLLALLGAEGLVRRAEEACEWVRSHNRAAAAEEEE